jgi:hypothetical protein
MKKLLLFVILLYAFASQAQTGYAVIAAEDVNFRKSPETTSEVIRTVKLGTLAKIFEGPVLKSNNKNWYKIQIGTQVGWMSADFVFELYKISDINKNTRSSGYSIYVATAANVKEAMQSGMMFEMVNFLVLSNDINQLSINSKVYPVRIKSDADLKSLESSSLTYRDKYLTLNPIFGASTIIFCDSKESGLGAMVLTFQGFTHTSMYSIELVPKFTEGVIDANIKHYYSNLPD